MNPTLDAPTEVSEVVRTPSRVHAAGADASASDRPASQSVILTSGRLRLRKPTDDTAPGGTRRSKRGVREAATRTQSPLASQAGEKKGEVANPFQTEEKLGPRPEKKLERSALAVAGGERSALAVAGGERSFLAKEGCEDERDMVISQLSANQELLAAHIVTLTTEVNRLRSLLNPDLLEFLTVLGNLTAEILTSQLHAELSKVTPEPEGAARAPGSGKATAAPASRGEDPT